MKCNKCGNEIKNDEKFCGKCGAKIDSQIPNKKVIKIKLNHLIFLLVIIVVIFVFIGCIINNSNTKKPSTMQSSSNSKSSQINTKTFWQYDDNGNITDGNLVLKVGDYVNYDEQQGAKYYEYISEPSQNGECKQVFNLKEYQNSWRVLGIENSQLMLISETLIVPTEVSAQKGDYYYGKDYFILAGNNGYEKGITELNNICLMYGQGKYASKARSITVKDINKITGYIDTNKSVHTTDENTSGIYQYNPVTLKSIWDPNSSKGEVKGISKDSVEYELLFKVRKNGSNVNGDNKPDCPYFLASKYFTSLDDGIFYVNEGLVLGSPLYRDKGFNYPAQHNSTVNGYIRPIVYLSEYAKLKETEPNSGIYDIYGK